MKKLISIVSIILTIGMISLIIYGANLPEQKTINNNIDSQQKPTDTKTQTGCNDVLDTDIASHRALGLIISNRQLLSIKLAEEKNFSPPGGHIEGEEIPETALQRELLEELNINIPANKLASYQTVCSLNNNQTVKTYYYLVDTPEQTINIVSKDDVIKWVDYSFVNDKKSDQELNQAMYYLKKDNLID